MSRKKLHHLIPKLHDKQALQQWVAATASGSHDLAQRSNAMLNSNRPRLEHGLAARIQLALQILAPEVSRCCQCSYPLTSKT